MSNIPKVIGEGGYGCVTKPSLKCTTTQNYTNRVSKVMTRLNAEEELEEMKNIVKISGIEKYIIRVPTMCVPKIDNSFKNAMKTCGNAKIQKVIKKRPDEIRLLLLDDGGIDLSKLVSKGVVKEMDKNSVHVFLTSVLHLFEGLDFFRNNSLIHHDIKLQNIVYNVETAKIRYIDFGLATTRDKFIENSSNNKNGFARSWYNFPPEQSCVEKDMYEKSYRCKKYRESLHPYETFINKAADSLDGYSLTLCLTELFEKLQMAKYSPNKVKIDRSFLKESRKLFGEYCDMSLHTRKNDYVQLHAKYKELLKKYHIYTENKPTPSPSTIELAQKYSIGKSAYTNRTTKNSFVSILKNKTKKQPGKILGPCPPGKIRNPQTRRCINEQAYNKKLNKGKTSQVTQKNKKGYKPCPPGKIRNPKTNRCIGEEAFKKQQAKI